MTPATPRTVVCTVPWSLIPPVSLSRIRSRQMSATNRSGLQLTSTSRPRAPAISRSIFSGASLLGFPSAPIRLREMRGVLTSGMWSCSLASAMSLACAVLACRRRRPSRALDELELEVGDADRRHSGLEVGQADEVGAVGEERGADEHVERVEPDGERGVGRSGETEQLTQVDLAGTTADAAASRTAASAIRPSLRSAKAIARKNEPTLTEGIESSPSTVPMPIDGALRMSSKDTSALARPW